MNRDCTATGHLSSRGLFLKRAGVCCHITVAPPPASESPQTLTLREIHVEARPGDVMAGAVGAAGPAPDVCDQPPVTPLDKYHNYGQQDIDAASTVVRAAWRSAQSREFES